MRSEQKSVNYYWIIPAAQLQTENIEVFGLSPTDRLDRQCQKLGLKWADKNMEPYAEVLILRGDVIYDTSILKNLRHNPETKVEGKERFAACTRFEYLDTVTGWIKGEEQDLALTPKAPEEIGESYNHILRKHEEPLCKILGADNKDKIEWRLYMSSYKGVTDLVTKYWWPRPAFYITKLCANLNITPNMVTILGAFLMFFALWAFAESFYFWGLLAGWVMTFLDTVDGKLARVTVTSSKWGHILDHGIDLFHPPFWYMAWAYGLTKYGTPLPEGWLLLSILIMWAFYILGRLAEGYFIARFSMHIHVWRKFDSWFRLILARRNPNLIILTIAWAFDRPDIGFLAIVVWHVITFAVHIIQSLQAEWYTFRGDKISSWLENKSNT